MKKIVILSLIVILCFAAGCQNKSKENAAPSASSPAASATDATASGPSTEAGYQGELPLTKEKVTLTLATHSGWSTTAPPPSNDLPVWKYLEELTNVHIEFQVTPSSSYNDTMSSRIAAGQKLPDIFNMPSNAVDLAQQGMIIAQDELYDKYAYYSKKLFDEPGAEFSSYKNLMKQADGKFYGFGNITVPTIQTPVIMLNMKWMEKLHLNIPTTTDELFEVLQAFRDDDPNGNGKPDEIPLTAEGANLYVLGDAFGLQGMWNGSWMLDSEGKLIHKKTSPQYKDFLTYVNKLYENKLLDKDILTVDWNKIQEYAANNLVGAAIYWSSGAIPLNSVSPLVNDPSGNTRVFDPILPLKGPSGIQALYNRLGYGGDDMAISASSKNQELAFKWLDFIYASPQAKDTIDWGIEGLTYKIVDGKKVKIIPEDKPWAEALSAIGGGQQPKAYIQYPEFMQNVLPDWFKDHMSNFDPYYKDPDVLGFKLTAAEKSETKKYSSDLNTFIDESYAKFLMGNEPLSKYDDYLNKLKQIGYDKYMAVQQEAYENSLNLK